MGEAISLEDAVDGGNGRQRSDSLLGQDPGDGLSSIRKTPVMGALPVSPKFDISIEFSKY